MGIHTLILNLYVAYYVMDPESHESYSWQRESRSDIGSYFGEDGIATNVMKGLTIGGMATMTSDYSSS